MQNTFWIIASKVDQANEKLAKLASKAIKLGLEKLTWAWGGTREFKNIHGDTAVQVELTINGPSQVRFGGWTFLAVIEHTEGGNLIRSMSEGGIPSHYHHVRGNCDHCRINRQRNKTIVVRHDDGRICQVGSTCVQDFLGNDVGSAVATLQYLDELREGFSDDGWGETERGEFCFSLVTFIVKVCELTHNSAYISKARADELGVLSTCNAAWGKLCDRKFNYDAELTARAKTIIEWCKNLSDDECYSSDYLNNLRVIARCGYVLARTAGFAASMVTAYERAQDALREHERMVNSKPQGTVGKRSAFVLTVLKAIPMVTVYGVSHTHIMTDGNGNVFKWKASSEKLTVGKTYSVVGTVKSHTEYKGVMQTVLSRCKSECVDKAA